MASNSHIQSVKYECALLTGAHVSEILFHKVDGSELIAGR